MNTGVMDCNDLTTAHDAHTTGIYTVFNELHKSVKEIFLKFRTRTNKTRN
jgi:hypothetical protein